MNESEYDERPWTEEQWEQTFRESDAKSAKFGELLETLIDHPNRDEIIAKEMGWDKFGEQDRGGYDNPNSDFTESDQHEEDDEPFSLNDVGDAKLRQIPAYSASYDWAMRVHDALKPIPESDDPRLEESLEAALSSFSIAAKIAGGDAIGYDDSLCGNIVCCKKALAFADESLQGLSELQALGVIDFKMLEPLIAEGQQVRSLVASRIAELRSQVWWE